jgi:microcystin-dependent protein
MPAHNHFVVVSNTQATDANPISTDIIAKSVAQSCGAFSNTVAMNAGMIPAVGGSQPHTNQQPYSVLNFIIALQGIFPSQN